MPRRSHTLAALIALSLSSGCASRRAAHEKALLECSRSGDAGRRVERHGAVSGYGDLSSSADLGKHEVTEVRDDCVYQVTVRAGDRSWVVANLSWVGKYVASPRGDRVAFIARDSDGWHVVVDGETGPAFDGTPSGAKYSADGKHVLYVGSIKGSGGVVMVDGKEVARAPFGIDYGALDFTSDGRYLVALRTEDGGLQVSAGGVLGPRLDTKTPGPEYADTMTYLDLTTSLTGDRFAYVGTRAGRGVLVVDGRELSVPAGLFPKRPLFSANAKRMLYVAVPKGGVGDEANPPALVLDGVVHFIPGLSEAAFASGEIAVANSALPLGFTNFVQQTQVFGVERLDRSKPAGEPADRIVLDDQAMRLSEIELRADGILSYGGTAFARVQGRQLPAVAE